MLRRFLLGAAPEVYLFFGQIPEDPILYGEVMDLMHFDSDSESDDTEPYDDLGHGGVVFGDNDDIIEPEPEPEPEPGEVNRSSSPSPHDYFSSNAIVHMPSVLCSNHEFRAQRVSDCSLRLNIACIISCRSCPVPRRVRPRPVPRRGRRLSRQRSGASLESRVRACRPIG